MRTKLLDPDQDGAIELAAELLKQGHLIAFPTDTVYGVGAHYAHAEAVQRLYEVKRRPLSKGIPILLSEAARAEKVVESIPETARALIQLFWPGPLTLVLPKRADLPAVISPNRTVGVRVPDDEIARRLIHEAGGALATTSANLSGERPAENAQLVLDALDGAIAAVVDGGTVKLGQASTVLDCTVEPPRVLRGGPISDQALALNTVVNQ